MKQLFFAILLCLCTFCGMQAQTLKKGDKFWDGGLLFTVGEVRMDRHVYLYGVDYGEFTLEKVAGKSGEYTLRPTSQADNPPYGCKWGDRVQYISQSDVKGLIFHNHQGDIVWTMEQITDDDEHCHEKQDILEQEPISKILRTKLLNRNYLAKVEDRKELRLLRNEIMARHGYHFQSKDLQDYFGQKAWYKLVEDNGKIKLSTIEQINVQILKHEENLRAQEEKEIEREDREVLEADQKLSMQHRKAYHFEASLSQPTEDGSFGSVIVRGYVGSDTPPAFKQEHELVGVTEAELIKDVQRVNDTVDINFDGIPDLQIFLGYYTNGRVEAVYAAYVWNRKSKRFERVEGFEDIVNPEVNAKAKTITSTARYSFNDLLVQTYAWKKGKLTLIKEEHQNPFEDEDE